VPGRPNGQGVATFSDRAQAMSLKEALDHATPADITRRGGTLRAEMAYSDSPMQFPKARPRSLRKKQAGEDEEAEHEDLEQMRERIAAVRLKEKRRADLTTLSGGGARQPWANDGFLQWQPSDSQHAEGADESSPASPPRDSSAGPSSPQHQASSAQSEVQSPGTKVRDAELGSDKQQGEQETDKGAEQKWDELDDVMEKALKARGLRAVISQDKGRSLVAARAFKPGDIILEQEPLAWALFPHGQQASKWAAPAARAGAPETAHEAPSHADPAPQTFRPPHGIATEMASPAGAERCHFCLKAHDNLRRCASCKYAHYCSSAHQRSDWPTHKLECARRAKSDLARPPTALVTMLAQISDLHRAAQSSKLPPPAGRRLADLKTLAAHYSKQPADRLTGYTQVIRLWAEFVGYSEDSPPPEEELRPGELLQVPQKSKKYSRRALPEMRTSTRERLQTLCRKRAKNTAKEPELRGVLRAAKNTAKEPYQKEAH